MVKHMEKASLGRWFLSADRTCSARPRCGTPALRSGPRRAGPSGSPASAPAAPPERPALAGSAGRIAAYPPPPVRRQRPRGPRRTDPRCRRPAGIAAAAADTGRRPDSPRRR